MNHSLTRIFLPPFVHSIIRQKPEKGNSSPDAYNHHRNRQLSPFSWSSLHSVTSWTLRKHRSESEYFKVASIRSDFDALGQIERVTVKVSRIRHSIGLGSARDRHRRGHDHRSVFVRIRIGRRQRDETRPDQMRSISLRLIIIEFSSWKLLMAQGLDP